MKVLYSHSFTSVCLPNPLSLALSKLIKLHRLAFSPRNVFMSNEGILRSSAHYLKHISFKHTYFIYISHKEHE